MGAAADGRNSTHESPAHGPWPVRAALALELQAFRSEIEEQADFNTRGRQVMHELHFVGHAKEVYGFVLNEDPVLNQHVSRELADRDSVVCHSYRAFADDLETGFPQFVRKRILIDGLQKPGTEFPVNRHRRTDDLLRQRLVIHRNPVLSAAPIPDPTAILINPVNPVKRSPCRTAATAMRP